jgi:membrane associated rhomboid family serine protease
MQQDKTFIDDIKFQVKHGGIHVKLIFFNVLVFLVIGLFSVIGRLSDSGIISSLLNDIFALQTDFSEFIYKPWGLFTSIFSHFGIFHLALNMLMLFFVGKIFIHYLGSNRLLALYFVGGIFGGILEIIAHVAIPSIASQAQLAVGASGSIMAIFIGIAFYKPNLPVSLFGLIQIKLLYIGIVYLAIDILSLGLNDGTAHFAHLGGAIAGIIASQNANSPSNLIYKVEKLILKINYYFGNLKNSKLKYSKNKNFDPILDRKKKSDEEFNYENKLKQEKTNVILDKISKSGYESLSKTEKEFLFQQSNK